MGSLLASVSHELNNPLSILVGQAQLLEERSEDPAVRERAELIKNAADRSARIVRTFLSMARQKPPVRVRIDLAELAREAVALVDYAFRTSSVEVEIETPPEPLIVEGDRDQLIQVVVNVLINAQQALSDCEDPRRVSIHVKAGEGRAVLMISDNGPGIDARMRERIFEPFFTTKPEGVGTGIGLAVSRNIATAHDGTLEVEAPPEGGAVFRLSLPVAASGETGGTEDETARIWRALPPLSVLFADDEPAIAMTARDVLEADGHRLLTAGNGREALDILRRDEVDVLITDLRMPVMDGMALWEELRRSGLHPTSAVGVVTGDTLGSEVRRFLEDTRVPVAEKPLSFDDLRKLIVEVVSTEV
ncbi:MAG: ATP-binding protein [Paracoccaceae bacterium]|nr:ATP-binding protein [Paracoccaceae bacterium]